MKILHSGYKLVIEDGKVINKIDVTVADSFVKRNKTGFGNGEARLYISSIKNAEKFFDKDFVENKSFRKAIILKDDLMYYLISAELEYTNPQNYYINANDLKERYEKHVEFVKNLKDNTIEFYIVSARGKKDTSRFYIRGYDKQNSKDNTYFTFIREILFPQISKISIQKIETTDNLNIYWFRPYMFEFTRIKEPDYILNSIDDINNSNISQTEKYNLVSSRLGQGKFRAEALELFNHTCFLSGIKQIEIIEACHIKPWHVCSNEERLNKYNSIVLNRNLHKLFDIGFFSFDENLDLIVSEFLNFDLQKSIITYNFNKNLLDKSQDFLMYHREHIFRR